MSLAEVERLRERLRELEERFDREMRTRGFDPTQAENIALPSRLAAIYAECEKLKWQIEEPETT
jgi:hypothetical protein